TDAKTDTDLGACTQTNWRVEPGPQIDYCFPLCRLTTPAVTLNRHWNQTDTNHWLGHGGPTRVAMHNSPVSTNDSKTWQPRDTFAWLQDGISNQIMIGEKHIPPNRLGKGKKENDNGQASNDPDMLDCSYMNTGLSRTVSSARAIRRHAAATTNDTDLTNWGDVNGIHRVDEKTADNVHQQDIGFGSYHPGSSNILFGDGTVHSMPPTTHTRIVGALSFVFDGNSVQIP
ncbi:MAG: DUF1559 domain-containing protein, partial [Planctomycetaceae bacterium]|nr:DUF1559 domain-containing protein [Planctomycetaceae bacterium]